MQNSTMLGKQKPAVARNERSLGDDFSHAIRSQISNIGDDFIDLHHSCKTKDVGGNLSPDLEIS